MIARKKKEEEAMGAPWIMSYGDMMSLLLCFFILIVSYSVVELVKFKQAMGSLRGSLGVLSEEEGRRVVKTSTPSTVDRSVMKKDLLVINMPGKKMVTLQAKEIAGVEVFLLATGVRFRIVDPLLFESGQVKLKPAAHQILHDIAEMVREINCEVRVEGHTDDSPTGGGPYKSNWDLSAARALAVVEHLVYQERLDPTRVWLAGFAENRPVAPNDTPENRAKNRRVEIFLNWESTYGSEGGLK
ncbi:MAG: flagellar motor protein MotB [Calditrichaeota bacterium]|nr:flagellar motor protein MotB [Calditrichota bacterium]